MAVELGKLSLPRSQGPRRNGGKLSNRLRLALAARGWAAGPEPQVRFGHPLLPGLPGLNPSMADDAIAERIQARNILQGRFVYLGQSREFRERIEWDPAGASTAWRLGLNSLDSLFALGVTATVASDPTERQQCYTAAVSLIDDWIARVRPGQGVGWTLPSLAQRIPNLLYTAAFFATELREDQRARSALLQTTYVQAQSLAASLDAQPQDVWRIGGARALFLAGRYFDGLESRGWVEQAIQALWRELREQVNDDGGHRERSPAKHAYVLAQYLEVLALLQVGRDEIPIWGRKRVKGLADFLARVAHPNGDLPLFHAAALDVGRPVDELLGAAAALLQDPTLASPGPFPGVWPGLLLGDPGRRVFAQLPRQRLGGESRAMRRTGYYVLAGDPGDALLLDGGDAPADGDRSTLGYELAIDGAPLIVHGGFDLDERSAWRGWFRSIEAHNLPRITGPSTQSLTVPAVTDGTWIVRDGLVYFAGTRENVAPGVLHRRRVICAPGEFWIICDQLWGEGAMGAESAIHLHPDTDVRATCTGRPELRLERAGVPVASMVFGGAASVALVAGLEEQSARQGWYATPNSERRAAPTVVVRADGPLPAVMGYAILPRTEAPATLDLEHDAFEVRIRLQVGDRRWSITAHADDVNVSTRVA